MKKIAILLLILFFTVSCATKIVSIERIKDGKLPNGSYLFFTFDQNIGINANCFFNFEEKNTHKEFMIYPNNNTVDSLLVKLPSGLYELDQIGCPKYKVIIKSRAPITVGENGIFYTGHFILNPLTTSHIEIISLTDKTGPQLVEKAKSIGLDLDMNNFFSSYTGVKISKEMMQWIRSETVSYRARGISSSSKISSPSLNKCFDEELPRNLFFLGQCKTEVSYLKGKMTKFKILSNTSTYSPDFLNCLKEEFIKFNPKINEEIVYTISL